VRPRNAWATTAEKELAFAAGGRRLQERTRCKRQFENSPLQQSIVDQVVFGRDMDNSGETQFDEEFLSMFEGSAGLSSAARLIRPEGVRLYTPNAWPDFPGKEEVLKPSSASSVERPKGRRNFHNAPNQQSIVDQVVFGRDMDMSGDSAFDEDFNAMFVGCAGRPCWNVGPASNKGRPKTVDWPPSSVVAWLRHGKQKLVGRGKRCRSDRGDNRGDRLSMVVVPHLDVLSSAIATSARARPRRP
jgi:hypothetical protein